MYSVVLMAALTAGSATPDCHRCGGCCGCYGGWGGCYGGCYGGWGGCYGGCYGGGWGGGCYGGCYGGFGGCMGCMGGWGGCYGCWGGYSSWGGVMPSYPGTVVPGTTVPSGEQLPSTEGKTKKKEGTMLSSNKAKLVVELPPGAKLFIDDVPMKSAPGVRSFNTPALEPGQAYYYMVRVETTHDGKPVSETRRVIVRAGQVARADFKELTSDAVRTASAK